MSGPEETTGGEVERGEREGGSASPAHSTTTSTTTATPTASQTAAARQDGFASDRQQRLALAAGVMGDDPAADAALQRAIGLGNDPGLGLLLDLAKKGEYDPWNVDIVAVTDTYLRALDERLDAQDLGRVARLIFYASALIHLKARALAERQKHLDYEEALEHTLASELLGDDGDLFEGLGGGRGLRPDDLPLDYGLFGGGDSRVGGGGATGLLAPRDRPVRPRGLSLVDLINALREYDDRLAERERELEDEPTYDVHEAYEECLGSSHQEDLEQDIVDVRFELWARMDDQNPTVTLSELVTPSRNRAASYLALLFLTQDEEVYMEQETFYGEVTVIRGPYFGEMRAGLHEDERDEDDDGRPRRRPATQAASEEQGDDADGQDPAAEAASSQEGHEDEDGGGDASSDGAEHAAAGGGEA